MVLQPQNEELVSTVAAPATSATASSFCARCPRGHKFSLLSSSLSSPTATHPRAHPSSLPPAPPIGPALLTSSGPPRPPCMADFPASAADLPAPALAATPRAGDFESGACSCSGEGAAAPEHEMVDDRALDLVVGCAGAPSPIGGARRSMGLGGDLRSRACKPATAALCGRSASFPASVVTEAAAATQIRACHLLPQIPITNRRDSLSSPSAVTKSGGSGSSPPLHDAQGKAAAQR